MDVQFGKLHEKGIARKEIPKLERDIEAEGADPDRQAMINEELESTRERKEQLGEDLEVRVGSASAQRVFLFSDIGRTVRSTDAEDAVVCFFTHSGSFLYNSEASFMVFWSFSPLLIRAHLSSNAAPPRASFS